MSFSTLQVIKNSIKGIIKIGKKSVMRDFKNVGYSMLAWV